MATRIKINNQDILIDYAIPQRDILDNQLQEYTSIIDGTRHYVNTNLHIYFTVVVYLWKHSNSRNKFLEYEGYQYQTCKLQPDDFWGWLTDGEGNLIDCKITEVFAFPIYDPNSEFDACVMRFRSVERFDSIGVVLRRENYPDGTDGSPIITDDNQQIILDI